MAANEEHWTTRRQRAVKCKTHGLHYDPRLTSGCALCRKELPAAAPRQKPQMVVMLLSLLAVAVILYRVLGPGTIGAEAAIEAPPETTTAALDATSAQLSPEPYRREIQAVDRAFFDTSEVELERMSDQILFTLRQLSRRLAASQPAAGRPAIESLDLLAARFPSGGLSLDLLHELRTEWVRLRDRHFQDALWYVFPGAVDPRTDRAALVAYRGVAEDLLALLGEGSDRAAVLSAPTAPNYVDPEDAARKREQWRAFRSQWEGRIADLKRQLPERPGVKADPQVLLAARRLEQAFSRVTSLASGNGLPSPTRIGEAFDAVEQARRSFDDLLAR